MRLPRLRKASRSLTFSLITGRLLQVDLWMTGQLASWKTTARVLSTVIKVGGKVTVVEVETGPTYEHCGRRLKDLKPDRLITLTGDGNVMRYDTGELVSSKESVLLTDVSQVRPAGRAIIAGIPVNNDGTPRRNGIVRHWIVTEGSFLVWW